MRPGVYDIPVPDGTEILVPDVAIVPMNAFDAQGYRLGYGGGYFDRTLAAHERRLFYIGAGPNAVTGPEGALKAKEAAYVTAEGFELEQAIHGPQVSFETQDVLILISVRGPAQARRRGSTRSI